MYEKILYDPLVFESELGADARSILTALLQRDLTQRLGVNGAAEIKNHAFFANTDFKKLLQKIQPPFKPNVARPVDVSNFDAVCKVEPPIDSVVENSSLSQTVQAQFSGAWLGRYVEL